MVHLIKLLLLGGIATGAALAAKNALEHAVRNKEISKLIRWPVFFATILTVFIYLGQLVETYCKWAVFRQHCGLVTPLPQKTDKPDHGAPVSQTPSLGAIVKDSLVDGAPCKACPSMVVIPPGEFTIGSPHSEPYRSNSEGPQKRIRIPRQFLVGQRPVTRKEFEAFVVSKGFRPGARDCNAPYLWMFWRQNKEWRDPGFEQGNDHPAVCISWHDALGYIEYLTSITGKKYRLLTEAEREYVARAGTTTKFWWGDQILPEQAVYNRPGEGTLPLGNFRENPWKLFSVHGNAWEWTQDCWFDDYETLSNDGRARTVEPCAERVLRGGSFHDSWSSLRASHRIRFAANHRSYNVGFRIARDL